jgi:putative DNA primase/helicase
MSNRVVVSDIRSIARLALPHSRALLQRLLPGGRFRGREYVALNPTRLDRHLGSFRVNSETGCWADFAVEGASGGDLVSLCAYLRGMRQGEAAAEIARMLGVRDD